MTQPSFVVPLSDLERGPANASWDLGLDWLEAALRGTEAIPLEVGKFEARLTKTGDEVLVQGRVSARVSLPDARTLEPVPISIDTEVFLMLGPDRSAADARPRRGGAKRGKKPSLERGTEPKKPAHRGWTDDPELTNSDAARDTYSGEDVVLDPFVREFLLLELPMVAHRDLPTDDSPGIAPPSPASASEPEARVDPRLAPLAAIAERLRERKS